LLAAGALDVAMQNQSSKKKFQIRKERLRNLTPKELAVVGGGNGMDDREPTISECDATDTCPV
jgi:hypothetical protein